MRVPFFDRTRGDAILHDELASAADRVLRSGSFILGVEVEAFENECAEYLGARHAVGVSSGTDALILALLALGIGPGDEVIVPAYTFVATAAAVARVGAHPMFVDVEPNTLCVDVRNIERELAYPRMKGLKRALIPVHLFGHLASFDAHPRDMIGQRKTLAQMGISVIEDAAQAFGTQDVGCAPFACHSFYPTKNLGGFGDAGMVTTGDDKLADRLRMLRAHGARERYVHQEVGGNFRLDELQAALLRVKLRHIDAALAARKAHAARYGTLFAGTGLVGGEAAPISLPPSGGTYNQFVIRVRGEGQRDLLRAFLTEQRVGTEVYYPTPLHLQPCFAGLGYSRGDFPVAEHAALETLALPIFPELTGDEIVYVVDRVAAFFA